MFHTFIVRDVRYKFFKLKRPFLTQIMAYQHSNVEYYDIHFCYGQALDKSELAKEILYG